MSSVGEQLWSHLVDEGYQPGDRLPAERGLASTLGVSRPTVRIAIGVLVGRGLLEQRSRSGTFVAKADAEDLLEIRLLLEPHAHAAPLVCRVQFRSRYFEKF